MTLADFEYDLVRPDLGKGVVCPACYADPHADEDLEPDLEPTHPASSQARSSISAMTPLSPTSSAQATRTAPEVAPMETHHRVREVLLQRVPAAGDPPWWERFYNKTLLLGYSRQDLLDWWVERVLAGEEDTEQNRTLYLQLKLACLG